MMNQVGDDMDRAIAFHMGVAYLPDEEQQDELVEEVRDQQERIEGVVQGFIERARGNDPLEPVLELVEILEKKLVVLQNIAQELSLPVQKSEQELAARKAQHARLQQELDRLTAALKKKGINLSHSVRKAGGGKK